MNFPPRPSEIAAIPAAKPSRRRYWIAAAIVAGAILLGVAGWLAYVRMFYVCGNCGAPILCTDPCVLPRFS